MCEACHAVATQTFPAGHGTARRLTGIGTTCASCHTDPHASELGADCQSCHSTDTFRIKRYTHKRAHLLRSFVPMLREEGVGEADINTMLVENPRRILAF